MTKHSQTVGSLGENAFVSRITRALPLTADVRVGAGDDCAVIGSARAARWQLLKTDTVVEGVHFRPEEDFRRVGWKALCRAISDIASMGGEPQHALITLIIRRDVEAERLDALYRGLNRAARRFGVAIVGGETSHSPGPLVVSVALTGSVERTRCVLRSGGKAGDAVYVTGRLGGSIAGKHLDFTPRLAEARWLVTHFRPRAMMDLSDGVGADLPRLARASGCGYALDEAAIPRTPGCSIAQALNDGEDYELLFAMAPAESARMESAWKRQFPRVHLTGIGMLTSPLIAPARSSTVLHGYDHFAQPR